MKKIKIPFGASDSEAYYEEIVIPEGLEAIMKDGRIILRRKESEDEQHRKWILEYLYDGLRKSDEQFKPQFESAIAWLEQQDKQYVPSKEMILNVWELGNIWKEITKGICNIEHGTQLDYILKHWTEGEHYTEWLEKQGKHRSCDSIELKFKVGDWIIFNEHHNGVYQVEKIQGLRYYLRHYTGASMLVHIDNQFIRHWTFLDARDGDVLTASDGSIFIFKEIVGNACKHYIALAEDNETIQINDNLEHCWESVRGVRPATKEQRNLLFQKMKENNWEWDAEKKELKKIENSLILSNSSKTVKDWTEEDSKAIDNCCLLIAAADDSYEKAFKDDCIHYLQNLKQRMEQ